MPKIVQLHRMNTAQAGIYTGPQGEVIVDTGSFGLRVQDGITPGGFLTLMAQNNLAELADKITSRNNLGLGSAAVQDASFFAAANSPVITGHPTIEGVTSTGATGTNKFVFDTSPTIINPIISGILYGPAGRFGSQAQAAWTGTMSPLGVHNSANILAQNLLTDSIGVTHNNNNDVGNQVSPAGFIVVRDKASAIVSGDSLGGISWNGRFTQTGTELRSGFASITAIANSASTAFLSFNPAVSALTTARAMMCDSGGLLIKTSTRANDEALTVNGNFYSNGNALIIGDTTTGHITVNGSGGGNVTYTGFGRTRIDNVQQILTNAGNPFQVTNSSVSNWNVGVQLIDGANGWSSVSDDILKTKFKPFENALDRVSSIYVGTGRFIGEPETISRSFMSAQSAQKALTEAVSEYKGILSVNPTDFIPLMMAAFAEVRGRLNTIETRLN